MDSTISHTSRCVSVKSTITIYIFLVCVSSVRGIKTGYEKKGRVHVRRYIQVCVCVCVCMLVSVAIWWHVNIMFFVFVCLCV